MLARLASRASALPRRAPLLASRLALPPPPPLAISLRLLSTKKKSMEIPEGSAYAVLGVARDVDKSTLQAVYKSLAKEYHPDAVQGGDRDEIEKKFQGISEAYQILANPVKRAEYDAELDAAKTEDDRKKLEKKYKASSWKTDVPDMKARIKAAQKEEPGMPPHIIAGTLFFITGNFIMVLNWLGG